MLKLAEVHASGVYPNNGPFARFKLREVFTFANLQLSFLSGGTGCSLKKLDLQRQSKVRVERAR
jgi:hypothetical protein